MASVKTIEFAGTALASLADNTLTAVTMPMLYIPENSKTFLSVIAKITADDIITATGGSVTSRRLDFQLGAAAANSTNNTNTFTHSSENLSLLHVVDLTAYFTANWTGSSMASSASVLIVQSLGTTFGWVNVCITLEITYSYDETSATQVKTVLIPLNASASSAGSSKGAATDTIPALDTYLPEASKTYRNISIIIQGNENKNTTLDATLSMEIDTLGAHTTGNYEGALGTDRWFRYVWNVTGAFTTNATHDFYYWASAASRFNHPQIYMVVTYEYDESSSTSIMNSLMLPMDMASPIGGTTSSDFQRGSCDLWIQEPGTITLERLAFLFHYNGQGSVAGLNCRVGTGSFVAYTDNTNVLGGSMGLMVRNDAAYTLSRGKNTISFDCYRTTSTILQLGWNISGFWIVNYSSSKASGGSFKHNKTIRQSLLSIGTSANATNYSIAAIAPSIPETNYFLTSVGNWINLTGAATVTLSVVHLVFERLSAEGGTAWESAYTDPVVSDPEVGTFSMFSQIRGKFLRYPNDPDTTRMNIESARRWLFHTAGISVHLYNIGLIFTYHSISTTLSGTISDSSGGTVNIKALRISDLTIIAETSRSGNGAYSMTVYDGTNDIIIIAYESDTLKGASKQDPAGSSFDISLSSGGSSFESGGAFT